jgi:hypothetical protein
VFADCSIPQEKSNAEINAELDLSDVSADEADGDRSNSKGFQPLPFFFCNTLFYHHNAKI